MKFEPVNLFNSTVKKTMFKSCDPDGTEEINCFPDEYGDNGSDCDPEYWDPCGPNE